MPKASLTSWEHLTDEVAIRRLASLHLFLDFNNCAIICTECGYALQTSDRTVSKHICQVHKAPLEQRKGLNAYIKTLDLPDPNQLELLQDGCSPYPHLLVHTGFGCRLCRLRSKNSKVISTHMSKTHKQESRNEDLHLQSWTQNGRRGYWIVRPEGSTGSDNGIDCSPRRRGRVAALRASEEDRLAAGDRVANATDLFFDRCKDTLRHTDHSLRCWLRSQVIGQAYKAPFSLPGRKRTTQQYCTL
ncbi:hypothetical protein K431DRAFT_279485 [Polychaeton citri CBS 116435]|uniref:Uncharacterized protein n=1 Tax=Polychaeton citri CBS 116435 TaxID=1314669 RepID=A0A9P4Q0D9_9PEZI|nr:hypothetical protein K431DRAFT_279485 [Polychaeton citri CBS 116435]